LEPGAAEPEKEPEPCSKACNPEVCTNRRVYIENMPDGVKADEIAEIFGGIGALTRERPKGRGVYKDEMPFKIKLYPGGKDCVIQYDDANASHNAPGFFDGEDWKGSKIKCSLAKKKPGHGLPVEGTVRDRKLHSRMPLVPTPARLKRACA
jgi:hypothetical protein